MTGISKSLFGMLGLSVNAEAASSIKPAKAHGESLISN
jgi:hypothetical protein